MIFVGVDIGTTRTKALLYDSETGTRRVVARPTPVIVSCAGDLRAADEVLAVVVEAVAEALAGLSPAERQRVAGIGITSLSEEMVLLGHDGETLGAMPAWYTPAGSTAAIGEGLDPSFSWAKLRWAFEQISGGSELFPGIGVGEVETVTTLNGFVAGRLAGTGRSAVDHSHASRTGFFDVREARWRPELFARTGWPVTALPELVPTAAEVGALDPDLTRRWRLPAAVPVVLAGHDHFCGAYGIGVRGDGELYISAGTSEAHCLIVDRLPTGDLPAEVGVGRFVDGERFYLHRQLPSGHVYRHWRRLLGLEQQTQEEETEAVGDRPIGAGGAVLVPGFDTDTRSWLLGVDTDADAATVQRALFEGLAGAALHVDRGLTALAHREVVAVIAAGVPCRSPVWREVRAHLSIAPLAISEEAEAPALGAALLAQRSVTGVPAPVRPSTPVEADPARLPAYAAMFERFENALDAVTR